MRRRWADTKVAIDSCHCERSEAISHCCTGIATHPAGARNDDSNQLIAKSSAALAANSKDGASNRQAGFSLVELLIAAAILPVVLYAIYSMYVTNMTTATWGNKKAELQQNARVALDIMEREIRMAGYNPSSSCTGTCANAIQNTSLSSTDLTFVADVDGNDITDKVEYTFHDSNDPSPALRLTITRSLWNWNGTGWTSVTTNEVVADDVSCPTPCPVPNGFVYKDGSDAVTTTPGSVRKITITITASGQAGGRTPTFTFASDVRLRNL